MVSDRCVDSRLADIDKCIFSSIGNISNTGIGTILVYLSGNRTSETQKAINTKS